MEDTLNDLDAHPEYIGCSKCLCRTCLLNWSSRCIWDGCFDNIRALYKPYDKAHPDKPPRTGWTRWSEPGEQAHWCRGGSFYSTLICPFYITYDESKTVCKSCLEGLIVVYQDGYIKCSLIDLWGCTDCYRRFEERIQVFRKD